MNGWSNLICMAKFYIIWYFFLNEEIKIDTSINLSINFLPKYWRSLKVQIELNSDLVLNLINQKNLLALPLRSFIFWIIYLFCFPFLIARFIQLLFVVNVFDVSAIFEILLIFIHLSYCLTISVIFKLI